MRPAYKEFPRTHLPFCQNGITVQKWSERLVNRWAVATCDANMAIRIKREYEDSANTGELLFLVDRLWPRGIRKDHLHNVDWIREVAPSSELRKWFGHDPKKLHGFVSRYFKELDEQPEAWLKIFEAVKEGNVTLLYGAKDTEHNQAVARKAYLEKSSVTAMLPSPSNKLVSHVVVRM